MIPINSFDNPSVISIQGVENRLLMKTILFILLVVGVTLFLNWFFKSKELETISDDLYRRMIAFANPSYGIKTDKDRSKI
jgi:hypothetical protein